MDAATRLTRKYRYMSKVRRQAKAQGKKPLAGKALLAATKKSIVKSAKETTKAKKRAVASRNKSLKAHEAKKKSALKEAEGHFKRGQSEQRRKNWESDKDWGKAAYASHMLGYAARRLMVEPASKLSRAGDINLTGKK